jgi:flagellar operon protein
MQVKVVDRNVTVQAPAAAGASRQATKSRAAKGATFAEALGQAERALSFSKHAEERLRSSGQVMDGSRMAQLQGAVDAAMSKGARSTLVLMKGLAFVVAPQTRTVVTVIPQDRMKESLFTSIDSAVVVDR